jgi:hypothetical protein
MDRETLSATRVCVLGRFSSFTGCKPNLSRVKVTREGKMFMQVEMSQLNLSARAYHRILKLARAIENLVDIKGIQTYAIFASHRDSDKKTFY